MMQYIKATSTERLQVACAQQWLIGCRGPGGAHGVGSMVCANKKLGLSQGTATQKPEELREEARGPSWGLVLFLLQLTLISLTILPFILIPPWQGKDWHRGSSKEAYT